MSTIEVKAGGNFTSNPEQSSNGSPSPVSGHRRTISNIALIMPKFSGGFVLDTIPINLAYLGAVLLQSGYHVKGFNLHFETLDQDFGNFELFGISATSAMIEEAEAVAKEIKAQNPKAVVVLGGAHATAWRENVLEDCQEFDFVIYGEGEAPLKELIECLNNNNGDFDSVGNLCYRQNGTIKTSPKLFNVEDLDAFPPPAKEIFSVEKYPDKVRAYGDIIGMRGCPLKCTNCKPGLGNVSKYRLRKPQEVFKELKYLVDNYGVKHFSFSDSELIGLPYNNRVFEEVCDLIIENKLNITFSGNCYAGFVNEEVFKKLKKAGCVFLGFGIESGSTRVLDDIIIKGLTKDQVRNAIEMATKAGIGCGGWFMVGIPGETFDDVKQSVEYAKSLQVQIAEVNIATPWPDTGFYFTCKEKGWILSENWPEYNEKKRSYIRTPYMTEHEAVEALDYFIEEMQTAGWRFEEGSNRIYHPRFLFMTLKQNIRHVLARGISISDLKKLARFLKISFGGLRSRPTITEARGIN